MADEIKRLHYYDQQFLREPDFTAEQTYHKDMRRRHNRAIHGWGIVEGLKVVLKDPQTVTIQAGMALDADGREIVLFQNKDVTIPGGPTNAGKTFYVTINYKMPEELTDRPLPQDVITPDDMTRVKEQPDFPAPTTTLPADPSRTLVLGAAVLNASGNILSVDEGQRRYVPKGIDGDMRANRYRGFNSLLLNDYQIPNPSSNVYMYSPGNDRDSWLFLDSADTGSNWGIYHRQIDNPSDVKGLPANSLGFIGGGNSDLKAYVCLGNGSAFFKGNVGIGTGTEKPGERLEIGKAQYLAFTTDWDKSNNQHQSGIKFKEGGSSNYGAKIYYDGDADSLVFSTLENNTEKLGISIARATGNVNIAGRLDVSGDIYHGGLLAISGEPGGWLRINQDNQFPKGTHFYYRANFNGGITTGNWWDIDPGAGNLLVQGRIGIGKTSADYQLDVNGTARVSSLVIGNETIQSYFYNRFVVTSGQVLMNNQNRTHDWASNYYDVTPPYGYTMYNLQGFIASISLINFNGDVDDNDTLWCESTAASGFVRVICNNSENRGNAYVNYLAIWRR